MRRVPQHMTERARRLRREATPAERELWKLLSRYRPAFTRQLSIEDRAILELACRQAMFGVELDGGHHHDQFESDEARTRWLNERGWTIIRLWNSDVMANPEGAARYVLQATAECLGGTHPRPVPSREGRVRQPRFK